MPAEDDHVVGLRALALDDVAELEVHRPRDAHDVDLVALAYVEQRRPRLLAFLGGSCVGLFDAVHRESCGAPGVEPAVEEGEVVVADAMREAHCFSTLVGVNEEDYGRAERNNPPEPGREGRSEFVRDRATGVARRPFVDRSSVDEPCAIVHPVGHFTW